MKKGFWIISPLIYFLIAVIFLICITGTFLEGKVLIITQFFLAVLSFAVIVWRISDIKKDITSAMHQVIKQLSRADERTLENFPMPCVAFAKSGEIIWYNSLFANSVLSGEDMISGKISSLFKGFDTGALTKNPSRFEVFYGNKKFTMYVKNTRTRGPIRYIAYLTENTELKNTQIQYNQTRPAAIVVLFDNKEEILKAADESERIRIKASVEEIVRQWISDTTGFILKISDGKFFIVIEEQHIKTIIERKFAILDSARKIKLDERNFVTLSIGVGKGAKNFKESENWANQALDMCLGRGGDQAAVKSPDGYIFFGGVSKSVEKSNKVRTRVLGTALVELIQNSDFIYIMGHKYSDLDCIGAGIGLYALTASLKKPSKIVVNRLNTLALQLIESYENELEKSPFLSIQEAIKAEIDNALLIIVDTHSPDFLESLEFYKKFTNVVVIDHHRKMVNHIDNTVIFFHEPYASSASEMVSELIQCINERAVGRAESEALMAGIMLDTKEFILKTGVRTFEAAAYLRRRGAETVEIKRFFSDSLDIYREKSQMVSNAEIFGNCAVSIAEEYYDNIRVAAAQAADELLTIQGIDASFVIYPSDGLINISARSLGRVNVQVIMEKLGGGGHATMAGAQLENTTISEMKDKMIKIIDDFNQVS